MQGQPAQQHARLSKQLQGVAAELKQRVSALQEERSQLLLQQHLLTKLAEVLGHYRSSLREGDELLCCLHSSGLEELLLEQLTQHVPALSLQDTTHTASSVDSNSQARGRQAVVTDSDEEDTPTSSSSSAGPTSTGCGLGQSAATSSGRQLSATARAATDGSYESGMHTSSCSLGYTSLSGCSTAAAQRGSLQSLQPSSTGTAGQLADKQQLLQRQLQQLTEPVSPHDDPFRLLRSIYEQPFDQRAHSITLGELLAMWRADVQQLRLCLQQLQAALQRDTHQPPAQAAAAAEGPAGCFSATHHTAGACQRLRGSHDTPISSLGQQEQGGEAQQAQRDALDGIREVNMRMFVTCISLAAAGREFLFFQLQLTNWDTGERLQEPCRERHRAALQELQLSPAQMRRITAGFKFFQQLVAPIVAERKQLHAQGLHVPQSDLWVPTQAAAGCTRPHGHQGTVGAAMLAGPAAQSDQGARLQAQCEQVSRLRLLLRKDLMLRGALLIYIQGCLSWVQQAKLRILMSPYHVNGGALCLVLSQLLQEHELQQAGHSQGP